MPAITAVVLVLLTAASSKAFSPLGLGIHPARQSLGLSLDLVGGGRGGSAKEGFRFAASSPVAIRQATSGRRCQSCGLRMSGADFFMSPGFTMLVRPSWLVYKFQQFALGSILSQLFAVTMLSFVLVTMGAFIFRLVVPDSAKKGMLHWMTRSYVMLNKVASNNPMVGDSRRERLVNNFLFNINTLTISVFTGLVAASSKASLDQVVNGNYQIAEAGHTVVLMDEWCEQAPGVIGHMDQMSRMRNAPKELRHPIVVLSNLPSAKAMHLIEENAPGRKPNVIVRQGDPRRASDLAKVCVGEASKVMILTADCERQLLKDGTPSDTLRRKIKTDAALIKALRKEYRIKNPTLPTALLAVPGDGRHWAQYEEDFSICEDQEFVGRLLAMCTVERSNGLSKVYEAVLKPDRSNFHLVLAPHHLEGIMFDDLQQYFPKCVVVGMVRGDTVELSPKGDFETKAGDKILTLADDFSQTSFVKKPLQPGDLDSTDEDEEISGETKHALLDKGSKPFRGRERRRVVVLGSNQRRHQTLREIAEVLPQGSRIDTLQRSLSEVDQLKGIDVVAHVGDTMDVTALTSAGVANADCIVALFDSKTASNTDDVTDSELLTIINSLGNVQYKSNQKMPRLVAQVHSRQTLKLLKAAANEAGIDTDFILSTDLESGALVQVLLNPEIEKVFNAVLASDTDKELMSLSADKFVVCSSHEHVKISFKELQARARDQGQVALGVMLRGSDGKDRLTLNPPKKKIFSLSLNDRVVVLGNFAEAYPDA